jgi:hypothetical protein
MIPVHHLATLSACASNRLLNVIAMATIEKENFLNKRTKVLQFDF